MKCRGQSVMVNPQIGLDKKGKYLARGKCKKCGCNMCRYVSKDTLEELEGNGLLGSIFGIDKIPVLGDIPILGALF